MKRLLLLLIMVGLLITQAVLAQESEPTAESSADQPLQPVIVPTIAVPTEADPAPVEPVSPIDSVILLILINARTDLEILATQQQGSTRPPGWSGSLDINNPQLPILIRLDLELLMATALGVGNVPVGWFGPVPSTSFAIARDIRHDLELLADVVIQPSVRPPGWAGDDPLMRCDRSTQNLVTLLARNGLFVPSADPAHPDYCQLVVTEIGQFTEVNLLNSSTSLQADTQEPESTDAGGGNATSSAATGSAVALSGIGLAFLDRYATQRVGTIPASVRFEPVGRSLVQFSRMTLVRGDNFEVFVDYKTTGISDQVFSTLPNVNNVGINTFCEASWCQPVTFIPGIGSGRGSLASTGLVNAGSNMIIHYDGDDQDGMTKVRMELCDRATSTNEAICEAVIEVILPDGSLSPAVDTLGGMAQFYVPYSYTITSVRSRNFFTIDLWIDPPEQRR